MECARPLARAATKPPLALTAENTRHAFRENAALGHPSCGLLAAAAAVGVVQTLDRLSELADSS